MTTLKSKLTVALGAALIASFAFAQTGAWSVWSTVDYLQASSPDLQGVFIVAPTTSDDVMSCGDGSQYVIPPGAPDRLQMLALLKEAVASNLEVSAFVSSCHGSVGALSAIRVK